LQASSSSVRAVEPTHPRKEYVIARHRLGTEGRIREKESTVNNAIDGNTYIYCVMHRE
jgi:hypothetical protein